MFTECGIFGVVNKQESKLVTNKVISGLKLLQHRGREAAGISYWKEDVILYKKTGLVEDVFSDFKHENTSKCIGHNRYSTSGSKEIESIQPYKFETLDQSYALVYNGNIKNINRASEKFNIQNDIEIDTKMIIEIIKKIDKPSMKEKLINFINCVNGVYCIIILSKEGLYSIRDSFGVRPFCIGKNEHGYCFSSESCGLQDYDYLRNLEPGELVFCDGIKLKTFYHLARTRVKKCIFEYIYFMNKNSLVEDKKLDYIRYEVGQKIANGDQRFDPEQTLVCGCPQTGISYGQGYSNASNLKYQQFLKKKLINNRTFILPENKDRIISIQKNLVIDGVIENKDLIILDDSLVRGNTMKNIVQKLKDHGAKSVHIRITSPPVRFPCYFGVDMPTFEELIASKMTIEKIRQFIGATTLKYTKLDTFYDVLKDNQFCSACFDGQYKKELLEW